MSADDEGVSRWVQVAEMEKKYGPVNFKEATYVCGPGQPSWMGRNREAGVRGPAAAQEERPLGQACREAGQGHEDREPALDGVCAAPSC